MTIALQHAHSQRTIPVHGDITLALTRQVLDKMPLAIFLVSKTCLPHYANGCGERMLAEGKFVTHKGGALSPAMGGTTQRKFSDAVASAMRSADASISSILLAAECGARAVACISPMPVAGAQAGPEFCGVFIATRPVQKPWMEDVLCTAFGLTPAEARVAALLAGGSSPLDIAEVQGLSVNTVRTHLSRAYMKTDCTSQPAFVATINALVPSLLGEEG